MLTAGRKDVARSVEEQLTNLRLWMARVPPDTHERFGSIRVGLTGDSECEGWEEATHDCLCLYWMVCA